MVGNKVNAVEKMQEYIASHINDPITLHDLAQAGGLSPWHASRLFKELIGKTPFEYIRALRISQAALKLRDENAKVIDVAFDFVFDTHEGFTRAFSRQFGITPSEYKRSTPPVELFIPHPISDFYRRKLSKGEAMTMDERRTDGGVSMNTVFVQVVERPARKIILKRGVRATGYWEYCEEVGCDVWGILVSIKDALYEPVGVWLPANMVKRGTSIYAQGVEVASDYSGQIPEGFEIISLNPCKMMIFQGPPFEEGEFSNAIHDLWKVIESYNPEIYGFSWSDQEAPRFQLQPKGYRGYIEGRPVLELNKNR